jgi:ubiquinone/menaquinone biosynthesis C-methylase UbiE
MVIGSILSKFKEIELSSADDKTFKLKNNILTKIGLRILGVPHFAFRIRANFILKEVIKAKPKKVLDGGCGYGIQSMILAERGINVYSLDLEKKRIEFIEAKKNEYPKISHIKTKIGSLTDKIPYEDESFDVVICSEVIEHIKNDRTAITELSRVLRKGGKLIITVPACSRNNKIHYKKFGHERPGYTLESLKEILGEELFVEKFKSYEYFFGNLLFSRYNRLNNKILMGLFFYVFFIPYIIDSWLRIGDPNQNLFVLRKRG